MREQRSTHPSKSITPPLQSLEASTDGGTKADRAERATSSAVPRNANVCDVETEVERVWLRRPVGIFVSVKWTAFGQSLDVRDKRKDETHRWKYHSPITPATTTRRTPRTTFQVHTQSAPTRMSSQTA